MDNVTHTASLMTIRENGDANSYALLDDTGNWWLGLLHNGEAPSERQRANMRRLAVCWNACDGIPTETLEAMGAGTFKRSQGREVELRARISELYELLRWVIKEGAPDLEFPLELIGLNGGDDAMGRARAILDAPTLGTPAARDVVPGWIATIRARLTTGGHPSPLSDIDAAELLAEIDAR